MSDPRADFLSRISSVGWGWRASVQMGLGGLVVTIRDQIAEGAFNDQDVPEVVAFHDAAEKFWHASIATNPPMEAEAMVAGLRQLLDQCAGPLAGFQVQVERALTQAESFNRLKDERS
ncbi:MAG: hypothetical protein O7I93_13635 [Gemmatimonadetes bacterium]|nr:hypothetical protein [Gemmatimonadota bacterium]